jgi:hypothetical protein
MERHLRNFLQYSSIPIGSLVELLIPIVPFLKLPKITEKNFNLSAALEYVIEIYLTVVEAILK